MAAFTGRLNTNEFYNSIYNMLRLAYVYADNLSGLDDSLANKYRADGGMYHDKSVYTDMDVLYSRVWDPNDTNVLAPEAVVAPKQQEIVVDQFRQIGLYTDEYLSKRAWQDASTYDTFRSVVQKQVSETKRVFEQRMVDTFVGTCKASFEQPITLPTVEGDDEATNRLQAQAIAKEIADLFVDMKDSTEKYNLNGFVKSFNESDFDIIWNARFYNKILYTDLPTIFHKDNLLKSGKVLASRYFGSNKGTGTADGIQDRSRDEYFIPVNSSNEYAAPATATGVKHVFAGDMLPKGTPIAGVKGSVTYADKTANINGVKRDVKVCTAALAYTPNNSIICKIVHKDAIKYLSSFETGTEFWNPKNLTTNRYLTWAYSDPETLSGYPLITLKSN